MDQLIDRAIALAEEEQRHQELEPPQQGLEIEHPDVAAAADPAPRERPAPREEEYQVPAQAGPGEGAADPAEREREAAPQADAVAEPVPDVDAGDQDEDDDLDDNDDDLSSVGGYDEFDSVRMGLTDEERQWALAIKELITNTPDLNSPPISDMMIAQIALVSIEAGEEGNLQKAKQQIHKFQEMRQHYQIEDSLEEARDTMQRFVQDVLPGHIIGFYFHPGERCYVWVADVANFDMSIFGDPDKVLIYLKGGFYYLNHCVCADLSAVRNGDIGIAECQGYHWKSSNMMQIRAFQESSEVLFSYPSQFKSIQLFHTGVFLNVMMSMAKKFFPSYLAKRFSYGHMSTHGRLDQLYMQPSFKAANQTLGSIGAALPERSIFYTLMIRFILWKKVCGRSGIATRGFVGNQL